VFRLSIAGKQYILQGMKCILGASLFLASIACLSCSADENAIARTTAATIDPRMEKIKTALQAIPPDISAKTALKIRQAPDIFFKLLAEAAADAAAAGELLRLVDKSHSLPEDYSPADLVSLNDSGFSVTRGDLRLRSLLMPALQAMTAAAQAAGATLVFASSYRSWSYQKTLYERNVAQLGQTEANRVSAQPGQSQHQLGTAFDMNPIDDAFDATPAGSWMRDNAWKFGFSLSYPQGCESLTGYVWESWHFRYIGKAAMTLQRDYFDDIQQYFLQFWSAVPSL